MRKGWRVHLLLLPPPSPVRPHVLNLREVTVGPGAAAEALHMAQAVVRFLLP